MGLGRGIEQDKEKAKKDSVKSRPLDIHRNSPKAKKRAVMNTTNSLPRMVNKRVAKVAAKQARKSTRKN